MRLWYYLCGERSSIPRKKNEALTQKHKDLAASIQEVFEEVLENTLSWIKKNYPDYDELVLSGVCRIGRLANFS